MQGTSASQPAKGQAAREGAERASADESRSGSSAADTRGSSEKRVHQHPVAHSREDPRRSTPWVERDDLEAKREPDGFP